MSRDGLLPPWASAVRPRFRTPWILSILVGSCGAVFAGLIPIRVAIYFRLRTQAQPEAAGSFSFDDV